MRAFTPVFAGYGVSALTLFAGYGSSNPSNAAEYGVPALAGTTGSCLIPRERNPLSTDSLTPRLTAPAA